MGESVQKSMGNPKNEEYNFADKLTKNSTLILSSINESSKKDRHVVFQDGCSFLLTTSAEQVTANL